jgi:hypothetical protein
MKAPENLELLPICSITGIFFAFVAYVIFAPDVLPVVVGGCIGVLIGLVVACLEEPPAKRVPIESEEDSFLRLMYRD